MWDANDIHARLAPPASVPVAPQTRVHRGPCQITPRRAVAGRDANAVEPCATLDRYAAPRSLGRWGDLRLDELWLDHDLGNDDAIWPVVEVLERAAFEDRPFDVGVVVIHSANPAGATKIAQVLRRWRNRVQVIPGSPDVGYVD